MVKAAMLTPNEFTAGHISMAQPISLLRPIAAHERECLIAGSRDRPALIILQGEYAYQWFDVAGSSDCWTGLIIPNLRVELDETSAFEVHTARNPLGSLVRRGTELSICAQIKPGMASGYIKLVEGLPALGEYKVGFLRWQLVLGERSEKRIIRAFDLT
ncbi:MAG: hypothetical protein JST38_02180 [Bacteroidetes bacterium]|nr:hypothetical protein [Bacteroidota bacterium]